jgi:hypothetical protein
MDLGLAPISGPMISPDGFTQAPSIQGRMRCCTSAHNQKDIAAKTRNNGVATEP